MIEEDNTYYNQQNELLSTLYDFYKFKKGAGKSIVFEMLVYPYLKKDFNVYPRYRLDFKSRNANIFIESKMDGLYFSDKQGEFIKKLQEENSIDGLFLVSSYYGNKSFAQLRKIYAVPFFQKAYLYEIDIKGILEYKHLD